MGKTLNIHITGEATVFRSDKWGYPSYSVKLSTQKEGAWEYEYMQLAFKGKVDLPNFTQIKINDGFLSFFTKSNGTKEYKIIVTSFDILNQSVGEIDIPSGTDNVVDFDTDLPW